MSEFDVRLKNAEVETIRFCGDTVNNTQVASVIVRSDTHDDRVEIRDLGFDDYRTGFGYVVVSQGSARNLIKAIEKAIELGWLEG